MSSVRLVPSLFWLLALSACNRPSEPPAGSSSDTPVPQQHASATSAEVVTATPVPRSIHDRDMPDRPPARPPSDQAKVIKASQILIAYKGAVDAAPTVTRNKEAAQQLAKFVGLEARAGADFEGLVAKYSDDSKTKTTAGQLGPISRTQLAKAFTDAAFDLMVKEITIDPVETALGFHIIKRTE